MQRVIIIILILTDSLLYMGPTVKNDHRLDIELKKENFKSVQAS